MIALVNDPPTPIKRTDFSGPHLEKSLRKLEEARENSKKHLGLSASIPTMTVQSYSYITKELNITTYFNKHVLSITYSACSPKQRNKIANMFYSILSPLLHDAVEELKIKLHSSGLRDEGVPFAMMGINLYGLSHKFPEIDSGHYELGATVVRPIGQSIEDYNSITYFSITRKPLFERLKLHVKSFFGSLVKKMETELVRQRS